MKPSVYGLLDSLRSNADSCDALLQNRFLNIASAIHTEYDLQLNEIDELKAQLAEVQDNRTGKAPCERFCEALATKKMFDNLQSDNRQLKAQVEQLRSAAKPLVDHYFNWAKINEPDFTCDHNAKLHSLYSDLHGALRQATKAGEQ